MASSQCMLLVVALFAGYLHPSTAGTFLPEESVEEAPIVAPEVESSILEDLAVVLDSDARERLESRLEAIKEVLRPIFAAMPESETGRLSHAAVRYLLHRYFSERHAWRVPGLADDGQGFASSAPQQILVGKVEELVHMFFEQRLDSQGLDLHEIAMFAATFEGLVRHEILERLNASFKILRLYRPKQLNASQVDRVLEAYMLTYIQAQDYKTMSTTDLAKAFDTVSAKYPGYNETLQFLSEARRSNSGANKTVFTLSEVEALVEEVSDQYGHWQNRECQVLKGRLTLLEDRSLGGNGSGRVRLADFYGSAAKHGYFQFTEKEEFLASVGALDDSDPSIPRVIIPNYISGMSSCIARSKYHSICCMDECESLLSGLERRFHAPSARADEIAEFVAALPSSSVPAERELPATLLARLEEIAELHGGRVPLHGRLFAQWMHHAYPRECPFPHVAGTTEPLRQPDYVKKHKRPSNYKMTQIAEAAKKAMERAAASDSSSDSEECTAWSQQEELYLAPPGPMTRLLQQLQRHSRAGLHLVASAAAAFAVVKHLCSTAENSIYASHGLGKGEGFIV